MGSGPVFLIPLRIAAKVKLVHPHLLAFLLFSCHYGTWYPSQREAERFDPVLGCGDCLHELPRPFPALFPMIPSQGGDLFFPKSDSAFVHFHPPLLSTDSSFLAFPSCKQPILGSIFASLLPKLPAHKELILQQMC